jgi:PKD repeat protein
MRIQHLAAACALALVVPVLASAPALAAAATNQAPTAAFTFTNTGRTFDFDGTGSSDADGQIVYSEWHYGDGSGTNCNCTGGTADTYTYSRSGTFTVTLTVTDNDGATSTVTHNVVVPDTAVKRDVTGHARAFSRGRIVKVTVESDARPANTAGGKQLSWTIKVNGFTTFSTSQTWGQTATWSADFKRTTGKYHVVVYKNGKVARALTVCSK